MARARCTVGTSARAQARSSYLTTGDGAPAWLLSQCALLETTGGQGLAHCWKQNCGPLKAHGGTSRGPPKALCWRGATKAHRHRLDGRCPLNRACSKSPPKETCSPPLPPKPHSALRQKLGAEEGEAKAQGHRLDGHFPLHCTRPKAESRPCCRIGSRFSKFGHPVGRRVPAFLNAICAGSCVFMRGHASSLKIGTPHTLSGESESSVSHTL